MDILWSDGSGSGIDTLTIDKSDVLVTGVTVTSVTDRGNGVWRFAYQGSLAAGQVSVHMPANHVADLHGNWNADTTESFTYAPPTLTVSISTGTIRETAGAAAATVTVTRSNTDLSTSLTVNLVSSDTSEATIQATVTIAANQSSATVNLNAVDDAIVDGTQTVTISASATLFVTGSANVSVTDHGDLSVVLAKHAISEHAGAAATTGLVKRSNGDTAGSLLVNLTSDDTSEASVPTTVTIAANADSATFNVDAVDDNIYDGTQTVNITATTSGFNNGSDALSVTDYELIAPVLNSNPTAAASLFLDFDGHLQVTWGDFSNILTPSFDLDGVPDVFSAGELAGITEIWQRVAEDYAPFNINVTTVLPSDFSDGKALRIAIGGSSTDWYEPQGGGPAGGVAYVGSFTNALPNVVFVFPQQLSGTPRYIAEASSHEAGHAFGLVHQSLYDTNGNFLQEYNPGTANWAPIMGVSYYAARSTWYNGPTDVSAATLQDDVAVLADGTNGFGFRADDYGNTINTATPLTVSSNQVSAAGIISTLSDQDFFSFWSGAGQISLSVNVAAVGANLDAKLELRKATGELVATADPSGTLGATIIATVAAGEYRLVVMSHGTYGDLGQYTISGAIQTYLNAAPVNNVPAGQTTEKDTPLTFNSANGNVLSTSDVDAGSSSLQVTLSVTHGLLTLGGTTGLSFTTGDGTDDSSMVFTGSVSTINAALNGLSFRPTTSYFGSAVLTFTTNDQGNIGAGGAQSDTDTVAISVVDTTPPTSTLAVSKALLTDSDAGSTFTVTATYSEAMDNAVTPTIAFSPAVTSSLGSPTGGWNGAHTIYTASYMVADANVAVNNIAVTVSGGRDLAGNLQTSFTQNNAFSIDTLNPTVQSVARSKTLLTDADAAGTFTVAATYNETMDDAVTPTIAFSPTVNSSLSFASGSWNGAHTIYTANYTVADANVAVNNIAITVSGGRDVHGNLQTSFTQNNAFSIDTLNPTVQSVAVSKTLLADADASSTFTVATTFSEAMDITATPTIAFSPTVNSSLSFTSGSWNGAHTIYTASYTVADADVAVNSIAITVSAGRDAVGNLQASVTQNNAFSIDTLNPTVQSVAVSKTLLMDADASSTFTVAATYSEAMDDAATPTIAFSPSVNGSLSFTSGSWNARTQSTRPITPSPTRTWRSITWRSPSMRAGIPRAICKRVSRRTTPLASTRSIQPSSQSP